MKNIDRIILHCAATTADVSARTIRKWHMNDRGWKDIGYHYVIRMNGAVEEGRPLDQQGAHTKGHNKNTIGVCYSGGLTKEGPADTMTREQEMAFIALVATLRSKFGEGIEVHGHNEYSNKACPSFDVVEKFGYDFCFPNADLVGPVDEVTPEEDND